MTRIYNSVRIQTPIEQVFDYVITPGNWPQWHPSLGVSGATDHSLEPGEQVTEEFRVAGRRGRVVWTVRERELPCRWAIEGRVQGGGGTVTYTLTPYNSSTIFEREFVYAMPNPLLALLDRFLLRRQVEVESVETVRRLKNVLEERSKVLNPLASPEQPSWHSNGEAQ
ncbi:MAG: SRPBCC family protein [Rubrobacter sp.]|nr:SRPBCC family protein [Rubrobacter sp.]